MVGEIGEQKISILEMIFWKWSSMCDQKLWLAYNITREEKNPDTSGFKNADTNYRGS
jgi:hypothetical protein